MIRASTFNIHCVQFSLAENESSFQCCSASGIEHIVESEGLNILQRERIPFNRRFGYREQRLHTLPGTVVDSSPSEKRDC